jgi:serine/threonine-protein phosphatase 5
MVVGDDYDGAKLGTEMTEEFITDMLDRFKNGKLLHKKYVYQIIIAVKKIVYDEATMVEMEVEDGTQLTVCGDTHGKFLGIKNGVRQLTFSRSILRPYGVVQT